MVSTSTRTQVSPLDEVISGGGLEAVEVCVSEASQLLVLAVVIELLEASNVDARRVGDSSLAAVALFLEGLLNHELPQENKPVGGAKQAKRKEQGQSRAQ